MHGEREGIQAPCYCMPTYANILGVKVQLNCYFGISDISNITYLLVILRIHADFKLYYCLDDVVNMVQPETF